MQVQKKKMSSLAYFLYKTCKYAFSRRSRAVTAWKCSKKVCCTCRVVGVLLIKARPVAFLTFSLLATMTATPMRTTKKPVGLS